MHIFKPSQQSLRNSAAARVLHQAGCHAQLSAAPCCQMHGGSLEPPCERVQRNAGDRRLSLQVWSSSSAACQQSNANVLSQPTVAGKLKYADPALVLCQKCVLRSLELLLTLNTSVYLDAQETEPHVHSPNPVLDEPALAFLEDVLHARRAVRRAFSMSCMQRCTHFLNGSGTRQFCMHTRSSLCRCGQSLAWRSCAAHGNASPGVVPGRSKGQGPGTLAARQAEHVAQPGPHATWWPTPPLPPAAPVLGHGQQPADVLEYWRAGSVKQRSLTIGSSAVQALTK